MTTDTRRPAADSTAFSIPQPAPAISPYPTRHPARLRRPPLVNRRWVVALGELGLVGFVYLAYRAARLSTAGSLAAAHQLAELVHRLEHSLRLPSGATYSVSVHFPITIASWSGASSPGRAPSTAAPATC